VQIFDELPIRGVTLSNRIVVSPMCQYSSTDGMANEGSDPLAVAASAAGLSAALHVLALSPDDEAASACRALAGAGGGREVDAVLTERDDGEVGLVYDR